MLLYRMQNILKAFKTSLNDHISGQRARVNVRVYGGAGRPERRHHFFLDFSISGYNFN